MTKMTVNEMHFPILQENLLPCATQSVQSLCPVLTNPAAGCTGRCFAALSKQVVQTQQANVVHDSETSISKEAA